MKLALVSTCLLVVTVAEYPGPELSGSPSAGHGEAQPPAQYGPTGAPGTRAHARPYPSAGYGRGGDDNEGANYEFQYDVTDQEAGLQFGHQEHRDGEVARGKYYVLLPDGRTQTVEYTADQDGYRPKISYEGGEGYGRGPSRPVGQGYNK